MSETEAPQASALADAHGQFDRSVDALFFFVFIVQPALDQAKSESIDMAEKLAAAERGEQPVGREGPIQLELTKEEFEIIKKIASSQRDQVTRLPQMLREMAFIYLVALFDGFLLDAFLSFLTSTPNALKSRRTMTSEEIIDRAQKGDLIEALARRELMDLSYKSMRDQVEQYKHWGVDIGSSGVDPAELIEIRARRNLFVHNGGVVNEIYLDAVNDRTLARLERKAGSDVAWSFDARVHARAVRPPSPGRSPRSGLPRRSDG